MNKSNSAALAVLSLGISLPINFLLVRWALTRLQRPADEQRRTILSIALAVALSLQQLAIQQRARIMSETK